jgi:hypothetical protein
MATAVTARARARGAPVTPVSSGLKSPVTARARARGAPIGLSKFGSSYRPPARARRETHRHRPAEERSPPPHTDNERAMVGADGEFEAWRARRKT